MAINHGMPSHKVKSQKQLDTIEKDWHDTLGTGAVNRAVHIERSLNHLRITTDTGRVILFEVMSDH